MPDYKKCVIYTIRTGDGLYIGSTCNFNNRKYEHKGRVNNENKQGANSKLYQTIRANEKVWDMQLHSEYPCNSKIEMRIEEERVRQELKADLNMVSCYGIDIDKQKQYVKEYQKKNKDRLNDYTKLWAREYRKDNEEYNEYQKQYQKKYRLANKEKIKECNKEWRLKNKDKLVEYRKELNLKNKTK